MLVSPHRLLLLHRHLFQLYEDNPPKVKILKVWHRKVYVISRVSCCGIAEGCLSR